uniref:RING-type domain-containing protein n=1 Tax=Noctiluca scintillans TaxID=2966 RepID=A0A7S1AZN1_NOCSC
MADQPQSRSDPVEETATRDHPAWMGVGVIGGAALGATFGGPVGAGVGAAAGFAAGAVRTYTGKHAVAHATSAMENLDEETVRRLAQQLQGPSRALGPGTGLSAEDLRAIEDVEATGAEVRCKICQTNKVNISFLPCGHACTCASCCAGMMAAAAAGGIPCPICRTPAEHVSRVFF